MATSTWNGVVADWNTDADWTSTASGYDVPAPGDVAVISGGTVVLTNNGAASDHLFENNQVSLGGSAGATLLLRNPRAISRYFNVAITGNATIEADGIRGFAASITGKPNDGSTITLKADPGGNLILLHGGSFNVADREVDFDGTITLERDAMVSGNIVNNGALSILSGTTTFATNSLSGTGTIAIGLNGRLFISGNQYSGAGQTISFTGVGGTLGLAYNTPGNFSGTIRDFAPGDFLDFLGNGAATSETINTVAHTLTIGDSSGASYVFNNFYGAAGALTATREANGHDLIGYASAAKQLNDQIDAGALAVHADAAHAMTVPGSDTPVTGAGVKVGIISNSFNVNGQAAADVANGYLPAAGVTVLREGAAGDDDEGRAMAELIHQVAPGASLYFASTGSGVDDFASSVKALQDAGCTVIVDDISLIGGEPFFQLGSPAENAISAAIVSGVTFVSSAGNYGDAFYQHAFTTTGQTLYDGTTVQAMTFSNGTPYQSITAFGGQYDTIDLQWDAPFYGTGGMASDQPDSVVFKVFDSTNKLVGTSTQVSMDGHLVAESELTLPGSNSTKTYNIAIYHADGTPVASEIKYIITGEYKDAAGVGGSINDPDAGVGSGTVQGHQLVPGVIAVAAADVTNTPAFGASPDFTEYFSSAGPGTLLFDANGERYAQPMTAGSPDVTGPDGIQTSVTGFTPFYGTSAAAPTVAGVAALLQQVQPGISPSSIASILALSALPLSTEPDSVAGAGLVQADKAILLEEETACYCRGTRILTSRGQVPVEALAIGDLVVTASGGHRPVTWLGHRSIDTRRHPNPKAVWPICVSQGAFGPNKPSRGLWLSPGHNIAAAGVLMPASLLVNGASVVQHKRSTVEYWHVELDGHDIILAEGLEAESYLDTGNRTAFVNGGAFIEAHPDFAPQHWAETCVPLVHEGPELIRTKALLTERAGASGFAVTHEADIHVLADGRRIEPIRLSADRVAFNLPTGCHEILLSSRTFVPAHTCPDSYDDRDLGIAVRRLTINGEEITLDDERLSGGGWNEPEREGDHVHRWTKGQAPLPAGSRLILIDLHGRGFYWQARPETIVALFEQRTETRLRA